MNSQIIESVRNSAREFDKKIDIEKEKLKILENIADKRSEKFDAQLDGL